MLNCFYIPPLWLLITNRIGWSLGTIFIIIALVEIVGQIAIKEKIFTKNNKIILIIMAVLVLIGLATTAYLYYNASQFGSGLDCV